MDSLYKKVSLSDIKIFSILLIPSLLSIYWHYNNTQLPFADATNYLSAAINIYDDLTKLNIYEFIKGLYFERSWRPVIFHLFYLPFLIISKGDLLFAIGALHTVFTFFSTFLIYKIIKLQNESYYAAILASIISVSSAVFFGGSSVPGFAEVSLLPFILGLVYLLIKEDTFTSKKYSFVFAILLFLIISTRPVEGLIHIILPIILFFIYLIKQDYISKKIFFKISLVANTVFTLLLLTRFIPSYKNQIDRIDQVSSLIIYDNILLVILVINIILSLIYFFYFKNNNFNTLDSKYKYLENSFYVSFFLVFMWWLGFFPNLYEWFYRTSIGDVVSNMVKYDIGVFSLFFNILVHFGIFLFFSIFSLFLFLCLKDLKNIVKNIRVKITNYYLYLIAIIPIPLIMYFTTVQSSPRKLSVIFIIILVILSSYKIPNNVRKFYLNTYLSTILLILFFSHFNFINTKYDNYLFINPNPSKLIGKSFASPITISPNPHDVVFEKLNNLCKKYNINHITLPINEDSKPVDPFLIAMMSIRGNCTSNFPYTRKFEKNLNFINSYNYALLINPLGKMIKSKKQSNLILKIINPNNKSLNLKMNELRTLSINQKYTYFLQYLYSAEKLKEYGWEEISCFDINMKYSGCLIMKIIEK